MGRIEEKRLVKGDFRRRADKKESSVWIIHEYFMVGILT
jgi:stalled ribosome alternative rescue factor ArfA